MKKIIKFFVFLVCILFNYNNVIAFDTEKIELDDSIQYLFKDSINIWFLKGKGLDEKNPNIYYQFVPITKEENIKYNSIVPGLIKDLNSCKLKALNDFDYKRVKEELVAEGKDYQNDEKYLEVYNNYTEASKTCGVNYDSGINNFYSMIKSFDEDNWIIKEKTYDSYNNINYYYINYPVDVKYYVLWIKAVDKDNNEIYNMTFTDNDIDASDDSSEEVKPDDKKDELESDNIEDVKSDDIKEEIKQDEINNDVNDENNQVEIKPEDSKDEVNNDNPVHEKEENPETGMYKVYGFSILCIVLLIILKNKTFISKL